eukprot:2286109-Pyramimonas_sp.AAC.1
MDRSGHIFFDIAAAFPSLLHSATSFGAWVSPNFSSRPSRVCAPIVGWWCSSADASPRVSGASGASARAAR